MVWCVTDENQVGFDGDVDHVTFGLGLEFQLSSGVKYLSGLLKGMC